MALVQPQVFSMPQMTLANGQVGQPEQSDLAKLIEKLNKDKAESQAMQEKKDTATLQGAGIQAAGSLASSLLTQAAARERAMQQAELESGKNVAELQAKSMQESGKAQQDAFARLMGSFRSAMV